VSSTSTIVQKLVKDLKLNNDFLAECFAHSNQYRNHSPVSPTDNPTASSLGKLSMGSVVKATRLSDKYAHAYSDFYGTGVACVYKSGPSWLIRKGPEAQGIVREVRPVYGHAIGSTWLSTGQLIYESLDSKGVTWTSIDPLAYANEGEPTPFCSFIVSIGVKPQSLLYDDAVAAADGVKGILAEAGFPDIEVAFVESTVTRSVAAGPKLLSFDPKLDDVLELRKPFSPILGLSIAPLTYPYFQGTGASTSDSAMTTRSAPPF